MRGAMNLTDENRPRATVLSRLVVLLPLAVFAGLSLVFLVRLGAGDTSRLPSALIGKSVPSFSLPALGGIGGDTGLSDADLRDGHVRLVNIFASWCVPCRQEHPQLLQLARDQDLARRGFRLVGLAYKDEPENARRFLGAGGNPYAAVGVDANGRTGIDWGVYGVPESFLIRGDGTIAYKFVGPISEEAMTSVILPEINKLLP
jgi:cytochrome c biogenesis protein CcmG/thiol:disulfide interchange protein DsbE